MRIPIEAIQAKLAEHDAKNTTAGATILHVQFQHDLPAMDYLTLVDQAAPAIAKVDGLVWKVFVVSGPNEAGGVYLFRDNASAQAYASGLFIAQLRSHPGIRNLNVRRHHVLREPSLITRGPVQFTKAFLMNR